MAAPDVSHPIPPHFASEFYLWLWWASEVNEGVFHTPEGPIQLWSQDRLAFRRPDESRVSAVMSGSNPAAALESRAALRGGKNIAELHIGIRRDDREFHLSLKGLAVDYSNLKLPSILAETPEEAVIDRMFAVEEVHGIVASLIREFARLRLGSSWPVTAAMMRIWAVESPGDADDDVD